MTDYSWDGWWTSETSLATSLPEMSHAAAAGAEPDATCDAIRTAAGVTRRIIAAIGDGKFLCDGGPGERFVQTLESQSAAGSLVFCATLRLDSATFALPCAR